MRFKFVYYIDYDFNVTKKEQLTAEQISMIEKQIFNDFCNGGLKDGWIEEDK